ncbi:glycoside hydrolase family 3 N-terminal domain-containing protein [Rudanella lutea]|uniref:glycoside hydrolase family 3 N-terminal domain-containing protein n=1 Tax=Rudanella lutea TaxID=451374 RepID=UPI00039B50D2|nr:glycoside hydrolase family 3 N-terminal domain-containing protein [Rudanella lutea]
MGKNVRIGLSVVCLLLVGLLSAAALTTPAKRLVSTLRRSAVVKKPVVSKPKGKDHTFPATRPVEVLAPVDSSAEKWIDSVFTTMTPEQKVGQFFMVATFSNRHANHYQYIEHLIQNYHIGGLIFFQGGPHRQALLTNRYQSLSKIPMLVGIDGEWGLGMRLDSAMDFPKQMALGALRDDRLVYRMGDEIGRQCRRLGIHINFAPVSDVNSNPANPVIGNRSFGESKENVARKASAYMRGLQSNRIIATAKHFPGHGDTNLDSHHTLPVISRSAEQLHNIDLYPFRRLIADSLMGVVTGHLHVPVVDNRPAIAATLSDKVVTELLKKELGFRGLVFTDAMNMGGISRAGRPVDVNLKALIAGNDILLYPENIKEATAAILNAVQTGQISQELIDEKVRKILRAKYWAGLNNYKPISMVNLEQDLNSPEAQALKQELCNATVTVVENNNDLLPIARLDTARIASIAIGAEWNNTFQKTLAQYAPIKKITYPDKVATDAEVNEILASVGDANVVIMSFHRMSESAYRKFGVTKASLDLINRLKQCGTKVVVTAFGSAYSLNQFTAADALICGYQDFDEMQRATAQVIFGGLGAEGVMPVSTGNWKIGYGKTVVPAGRLAYGTPESVGMNATKLKQIDQLMQTALAGKVVPGSQIIVARKGKIVYEKYFGKLTYAGTEKVTGETLYDLASLTKVLSTLQAAMLLHDRKQLDITQKASVYLPELRGTNKQNIVIQDLLWHQSGMVSYYPTTWDRTRLPGGGLKPTLYSATPDSAYTLQVAPNLWARTSLKDSVWKWVVQSPMSKKIDDGRPAYVYSDLNFLMLQKIVERITKQPLDQFVEQEIYKPLGLVSIGFTPLQRFANPRCAPTENDTYYRNTLLIGTVHDQMAAVQGGVSGHAGLFGNARDVAALLQMNLQRGEYGGYRVLQPNTVPYFSQTVSPRSHRSLGWDRPNPETSSVYVAEQASERSFGHTGFTGNVVWVDPNEELVFVFLSNRIHPTAANTSINTTKLRRKIHEVIYSAIE